MKKLNSQKVVTIKGVYLCVLTVYALLREVLALQEIVGSTFITYGFFAMGVLLVVALVLCDRKAFLRKSQWLPIAFLIICMLSAIVNYQFDFMSNVKAIAWMALYFMLLLPETGNIELEARNRKRIITTAVITMVVLSFISLPMYFFNIDYTYVKPSGFSNNQGFSHQYIRLWGIFNDANTAAVYSLVCMCFAMYLFAETKKQFVRVLLGGVCIVLFLLVVLSNSRTALVAFVAASVWISLCVVLPRSRGNTQKKIITAMLIAVVTAGATVGVYETVKLIMPYEKFTIQSITSSSFQIGVHKAYDKFYQSSGLNITEGYYEEDSYMTEHAKVETTETTESTYALTEEANSRVESLDRTDEKTDLSNGRFVKWLEVLKVFKKMPILGASPRGISSAAKQINADGSVAKFGMAAHNSLLEVLAGTGILGFAAVFGILIWLLWIVLRNFFGGNTGNEFRVLSTVLLVMVCEMLFISDVFFSLTFGGITFWMAAGHLFAAALAPAKKE